MKKIAEKLNSSLSDIRPILFLVNEKIKESQIAMDKHDAALIQIVEIYTTTENNILRGLGGARSRRSLDNKGATNQSANNNASNSNSIWGADNSYNYEMGDGNYLTFHKGEAQRPAWEVYENYDNDFAYDPDAKPTKEDYVNWVKWSTLSLGANILNHLPDGVEAYEHYIKGSGEPLELDYTKAYNEDSSIRQNCDRMVSETNKAIHEMISRGEKPPFSITSEFVGAYPYPQTENWQKAIGGHQVWISADVSYDANGNYVVETIVHAQDRYNFNRGQIDIKTKTPDDVNGRFEELGWAKSYDTYGEVHFTSELDPNGQLTTPEVTSNYGKNRHDYTERSDSRSNLKYRSKTDG